MKSTKTQYNVSLGYVQPYNSQWVNRPIPSLLSSQQRRLHHHMRSEVEQSAVSRETHQRSQLHIVCLSFSLHNFSLPSLTWTHCGFHCTHSSFTILCHGRDTETLIGLAYVEVSALKSGKPTIFLTKSQKIFELRKSTTYEMRRSRKSRKNAPQ